MGDIDIPMRFWSYLKDKGDVGMGENNNEIDCECYYPYLPKEFWEVVDEIAKLSFLAQETGTHAPDEWKSEDIDKVRFKADRHLARARYGSYIDDQFKMSAYVHAIWRYMQEYSLIKKCTRNLIEEVR